MNPKAQGEKGQRIAIGVLAKWNIDVALPMTDNLPFDFIVIHNGKLYKVQVKSGEAVPQNTIGSTAFKLTTSNWYKGTSKKYSATDVDIVILCDYNDVYLLNQKDFVGRSSFSIRKISARNKQMKGVNMHDDFVISEKRINDVFI